MRKIVLLCGVLLLVTGIIQAQDEPTPYDIILERILEEEANNATRLSYLSGSVEKHSE